MKARIAVIAGDGIGPEVVAEALGVLRLVARRGGAPRLSPSNPSRATA